jgi:uncharacterized protein YcbX
VNRETAAPRVVELWRYPVKSMLGERVDRALITADGIHGDRQFAVFDRATGLGLTARKVPQLLFASARLRPDGDVEMTLPDGSIATDDGALSRWLDRDVTLRRAEQQAIRQYENTDDFESEATSGWSTFDGADGAYHDSPRARVSLVSAETLRDWDPRRFRANVYLDGGGEDEYVGATAALGDAVLDIGNQIGRCVMVTRPQADGIARDLDVLRVIRDERGGCLSVGATVLRPGGVELGDALVVA